MQIIQKKYLIILIIFIILGLLVSFLVWFLSPQIRQAWQLKKGTERFNQTLKVLEAKYANDSYGGKTPEETYQLFLEALKNQDIDLASKYFILDKQEEYKKLLTSIKNNNDWDKMMADLLLPRNQHGKMIGDEYRIEIVDENNVSVTTIVIKKPVLIVGSDKKEISNLWKITQF